MSGGDNWALSSLGHAIMILAHFHALSSFVLASGIATVKDEEVVESSSSGSEGDCLSTVGMLWWWDEHEYSNEVWSLV